jgi:DNA repair exonuclease SbcCD ATPase subunit
MILFKRIAYRNFLSSGNTPTEIFLNVSENTLIVGHNGSGKSTLLDALCFVLFNKAFRKINKSQLVNTINEKDCVVEVEFSISNKEYKVIRGIKPTIFEIWIDGVLQNQSASSMDQQKYLEDIVLKLNYRSFTQIVILGSASFVPFMQLSTSHRREVVEDLLDIKIFSSMNVILKEKIKKVNEKIKELEIIDTSIKEKISMQEKFIEELEKRGKNDIDQNNKKIKTLLDEIDSFININLDLDEKVKNITEEQKKISDASNKLKKLNNLKGKITQKASQVSEQCNFFANNTVCPTCTQNIDEKTKLNKIEELNVKKNEFENGIRDIETTIIEEEKNQKKFLNLSDTIIKISNEITQNNTKISFSQRHIKELECEIQKTSEKLKNKNIEHENLEKLKKEKELLFKKKSKYKEAINYLDFSQFLMKDGGVKAKIIKKYIPLMNQQVNKYLQMMDFYINFTFDEEFKENIKSPMHDDFSYDSFSEGEKMRINLAILFTWREIAKMKNSINTNLLIMDEVFDSSLDMSGTDYFTKIIKYVVKDSNVFVISHKVDELTDKFDSVIQFKKVKGFSKIIS